MKAAPFDYAIPASVAEAVALKQQHGDDARFLAGGQSLLPAMNMRVARPGLLIDLNRIDALVGIKELDETLCIGALTRTQAIGLSDIVARRAPLLAQCVDHIAHPAIRSRGTFGGSIAHADPTAEWPASCLALDARMVAVGQEGERTILAGNFFRGNYLTALREDEVLIRVEIPAQPENSRSAVMEIARRRGDFAVAGVLAQAVPVPDGTLSALRVAFFGIADRPVRIAGVEACLENSGRGAVAKAMKILDEEVELVGDLYHTAATKRHLTGVLLDRALADLLAA